MSTEHSTPTRTSSISSVSKQQSISSLSSTTEDDKPLPAGAPTSVFFEIQHTPNAGRAIFASQDIPEDTLIWRSEDLSLSVLLREYRREVCGQCFGYEYGRNLEVQDKPIGFAFCSKACLDQWMRETGDIGVQAWTAAEKLVKGRSKEDNEMIDVDLPRPRQMDITKAWESVAAHAALVRIAREGEDRADSPQVTKQHKKALQKAILQQISPDVMSFCVSGVLWRYSNPEDWGKFLALAADSTPYHNTDDLDAFTRTYLHLLAVLPLPLLPLVTEEMMLLLSSRDSHNSFGIRSLEDDGSEVLGLRMLASSELLQPLLRPEH